MFEEEAFCGIYLYIRYCATAHNGTDYESEYNCDKNKESTVLFFNLLFVFLDMYISAKS